MTPNALYQAFAARDSRFDGVFFVGVTSTGIYCRPVCTARTPKQANCRFFESAEAAEKASFRPCLRCRPELAPGNAPVDDAHRIAHLVAQRIEEGAVDGSGGLEAIAQSFGWSSRQIRRLVHNELGVSPMDLVMTRRLLLAKQLLTETRLPITDVAFASGFASLRRFNDAFSDRYGMPPTQLRKAAHDVGAVMTPADTFTLRLGYRAPLEWDGLLDFLAARAMQGTEAVRDGSYLRTVQLGDFTGWVRVTNAARQAAPGKTKGQALNVELTHSLVPVLPALLGRLRHLFDLSARPDVIAGHLMPDPLLAGAIATHPGLRVPGAFDGFELAVRAILGQQVTVRAATTVAGRFAEAFGEPLATPHPELRRLTPTPHRVSQLAVGDIASLGIIQARARSIIAVAQEVVSGRLRLEAGADPDATMKQLMALPGVGNWTAQYIAMRALRWPDAFPSGDIAVRNALGGVSATEAEARSESWRPWRSYAVMYLWRAES
jgi:AraC family transcriptional regulator of adaptative response / DNA-3-methyladenine glycosylase II